MSTFKEFLNEAISKSAPYHIIKKSKDTLGTYNHVHGTYDDYDEAVAELLKMKSKPKHSFFGYKILNAKELSHITIG